LNPRYRTPLNPIYATNRYQKAVPAPTDIVGNVLSPIVAKRLIQLTRIRY